MEPHQRGERLRVGRLGGERLQRARGQVGPVEAIGVEARQPAQDLDPGREGSPRASACS